MFIKNVYALAFLSHSALDAESREIMNHYFLDTRIKSEYDNMDIIKLDIRVKSEYDNMDIIKLDIRVKSEYDNMDIMAQDTRIKSKCDKKTIYLGLHPQ